MKSRRSGNVQHISRMDDLVRKLKVLANGRVLVGVPADKAERKDDEDGEGMNNATLAYIHEFGSPAANIPARPFLSEGIKDAREKISKRMSKVAQKALQASSTINIDSELQAVGLTAQGAVQEKINSGEFEPLSDATLRARAAKYKSRTAERDELASRAAGNAPSTNSVKPLIDTGQLRNAINYVVKKG